MVCGRLRSRPYPRKLTEHLTTASNPQLTPLAPQLALRQLRSLLGSLLACRQYGHIDPHLASLSLSWETSTLFVVPGMLDFPLRFPGDGSKRLFVLRDGLSESV